MNGQQALWRRVPSAVEALTAMQRGILSAEELHQQCDARSGQWDRRLKAWVRHPIDYRALNVTDTGRNGEACLADLGGVPVAIKDIIDVRGWPTLGGGDEGDEDEPSICCRDATIVVPLRIAGAELAGKTVTCQYASFDPAPTLNPWNPSRTPGGSSAGSAAAVATGQCLIALGTQTGGSIIRPASYCGVCGFKPAHDPKWLEGVIPVSGKLDHVGPIARCVEDLELAWSVIVEPEMRVGKFQAPTLGVLRDYFWDHSSPEMQRVTDLAIARLKAAGAILVEVPLPHYWETVHSHHRTIMAFDCARVHAPNFDRSPHSYLPNISALIREGLAIPPYEYSIALQEQLAFREQLLHKYRDIDALITPATTTTAPTRETTGDPRFNSPWSFAGVPAVCFPSGLASDGMPCGLQLIRPHGMTHEDDFTLLAIAKWCEAALDVDLWPELNKRLEQQFPNTKWIDPPC
jgi:Asp-tRNA(Asn)/Glu-tRNA(Gln) amidotransferase A subunit family amidase